ncbi:MAG: hypothetical protein KZQ82_07115 [Candidatus Thiodiazotropha sp. (ex Lucinoma annulata)]|nr:hypothetical protein [Candidatus Thiodiazotropha sp. (ex Lucinoma annulata)]
MPLREDDEVIEEEYILRRVPNRDDYFNPRQFLSIDPQAFRSNSSDVDGISVSREMFIEPSQLSLICRKPPYIVVRLLVRDILNIGLTVIPAPTPEGQCASPGHALIPELKLDKTLKGEAKKRIKKIRLELAKLASNGLAHEP